MQNFSTIIVNVLSMDTRFTLSRDDELHEFSEPPAAWVIVEVSGWGNPDFCSKSIWFCLVNHALAPTQLECVAKTKDRRLHKFNYSCQGGRKHKGFRASFWKTLPPRYINFTVRTLPTNTCRTKDQNYMGVSNNRGTPKWKVYNGKPY